jgi:2-keto-3-deoxy-6-phosphogluconate aldolase
VYRRACSTRRTGRACRRCRARSRPTEILDAHEAGADLVKVFPSDALGPAFIKGVLAPMPFLRLMPTGGVTPDNVGEWLRAARTRWAWARRSSTPSSWPPATSPRSPTAHAA